MPDVREQLERLRPTTGGCNLHTVVRYGNAVVGVIFLIAGIYSIVTFFTNPGGRNAIKFVTFIYICCIGILLALAELNFPSCTLRYFGFLSSRYSRAFFQIFPGILCLSIGFDGDKGKPENIFLIIAGLGALVFAFLGFCYGTDYSGGIGGDVESGNGVAGGGTAGTSAFGRRKHQATVGPDITI